MKHTLLPALAITATLTLMACGKNNTKPTGTTATPPAPEVKITKENVPAEVDKLAAEIEADK